MNISNKTNLLYSVATSDGTIVPTNAESNEVNTEILSYSISKTLTTDKTFLKEGETAHNTVTVTNNSATKLTYTFISNPTPQGAGYVAGSVKVNGVSQPTKDMITGFYLPDLNPGETVTIEYDIQINKPTTENTVTDYSEFQYYVNDPVRGNVKYVENTNPVSFDIISNKISVVKSVDKTFAVKGETLTYTITVTNEGALDLIDIFFTDGIPQGTTFVENSVTLNGTKMPYSPESGYYLTNLPPKSSATTVFQVTVN